MDKDQNGGYVSCECGACVLLRAERRNEVRVVARRPGRLSSRRAGAAAMMKLVAQGIGLGIGFFIGQTAMQLLLAYIVSVSLQ